ncbi:MAG TPA: hypothetical protein PKV03_09765 [Methylotenera sp.]|nr:hypothetical protein [Methylotenera sp.]
MTFDLHTVLPLLIPKAIAWAQVQSSLIEKVGQPLNDSLLAIARSVGVMHPELIRVAEVSRLPLPEDPELQQAALESGLLGPNMVGMTFGYGIYVCHGHNTIRLLSHEFRHSFQYEQAGSIAAFLPTYLQQIVTVGYNNAPFEIDARAHERHHA